jgi:hypothetical protein
MATSRLGRLIILASGLAALPLAGQERTGPSGFPPAPVVAGTPSERGQSYGKQFREPIREFLDKEIYTAFVGKPSTKEQLLGYAAACGKVVRDECPTIAAEFQGIAEGSGLTFDEIVLINLHEELYHRTPLPAQGHCTAVAVAPPDTGNGHALAKPGTGCRASRASRASSNGAAPKA